MTGNGAGQLLTNTSGAFLFTVSSGVASTAYSTILSGFDDGIEVGGSEYIFHVINPSSAATTPTLSATVSSPLDSAADITKSGRGALILSGNNTAGGGARRTTINEGVLEIADLDNIGGNTGGLVFAGGALRLGLTLTDDITLRTITILSGGATIDTNTLSPTFANSIGSGAGGLTKIGVGNLTLNGTATYTGPTAITTGTLTVGANNATGNGGNVNVGAGAELALGANNITAGLVTTSGASPLITGTGTITASAGFAFTHTGDTAIAAILAGAGGLFKNQTNVVTLSGLSTYTGTTEVQAGTLNFNSIGNVGGGASALGNPSTAENGIIRMGLTTAATTLSYSGTGHSSDRIVALQGTTGGVTLDADGSGALVFGGGAQGEFAGAKTLTLQGSSATGINNGVGVIRDYAATISVLKAEANTWELTAANTYTGATTAANGILRLNVDQTMTGGLVFGAAATAGTLDMTGANAQFSTMTVVTNSASLVDTATIGAGKTLTITGNVTIGVNAAASSTLFTANGGGAFVNNNTGGTFQVGGATGGTNANSTTADFSALASFTVNLGAAGLFRIGDNSTVTGAVGASQLTLAAANTITAGTIQVAATQTNTNQLLHLGSATNVLNADTLVVGGVLRSSGTLDFASPTGTMTLRAADGTSRAAVSVTSDPDGTTSSYTGTVNLAGHSADLLISTLTMADRAANTGGTTATFTFDDGTLDVTSLILARRTSTGTGGASATLNLGDGAVVGTPTVTIGVITMAENTSAGGAVTGDLNVTGGNVTIGTGSGTAINMANAGASRTITSTIDFTGGTVAITGDIVRTGGAGTENATVTLDGASLNMSGKNIGVSGTTINFAAQSGTLTNLAELNGGGTFTKTTAGTLILGAGNAYTGATNVSDGTLQVGLGGTGVTGTGLITAVKAAATYADAPVISGSGTLQGGVLIGDIANAANKGVLAPGDGNTTTSNAKLTISAAGGLTIAAGSQTRLGITAASGTDAAFASSGLSASAYLASLSSTSDGVMGTAPAAWFNQPGSGQGDFINLSHISGALTLGTNGGGAAAGEGIVSIFSNGLNTGSLAAGQIFNLVDWFGAFSGSFNVGSGVNAGGVYGDFDLPDISMTTYGWDTSAFTSHGVLAIVVVPEPSRALLLLFGLLGLLARRRRQVIG